MLLWAAWCGARLQAAHAETVMCVGRGKKGFCVGFDAKSGAFGCASLLSVVALIGAGVIVLVRPRQSGEAWALYLIACGVAALIGFMVFGRRSEAADIGGESAAEDPERQSSQDESS